MDQTYEWMNERTKWNEWIKKVNEFFDFMLTAAERYFMSFCAAHSNETSKEIFIKQKGRRERPMKETHMFNVLCESCASMRV